MSTWIYGVTPDHPFFDQEDKIRLISSSIKSELAKIINKALMSFKTQLGMSVSLFHSIKKNSIAWDLAIKTTQYGAIYWISREEARYYLAYLHKNKILVNDIADFLKEDNRGIRLFNYAIHAFILNKKAKIKFSNELIPRYAISFAGYNKYYVNEKDFFSNSLEDSFNTSGALYDLHDFAHMTAATLNRELYGNHCFDSLIYLPPRLRDLIKSNNYKTHSANRLSDGLIFSELSLVLFDNLDYKALSHYQAVEKISTLLCNYLLKRTPLLHRSTNQYFIPQEPISIIELATLVQNKAYELPASEIEQKLFTRGGTSSHDPLKTFNAAEIIEFLADNRDWLYFEMRNTLRHRAHKEAYKKVAEHLFYQATSDGERRWLKKIIDNINYKDFHEKRRINLWKEILKHPLSAEKEYSISQRQKTNHLLMQESYY